MARPVCEQETTINFTRDGKMASVWTSDTTVMTKLDHKVEDYPEKYKVVDVGYSQQGDLVCKTYEFPKKLLSYRSGREMSEEQKQLAAERFRKMWAEKQNDTAENPEDAEFEEDEEIEEDE